MKPDFQKVATANSQNSFSDFWVKANHFGFHWHYHPEIEICYIKKGSGHRIIGESVEDFTDGDLVLVGSNLPHCWITDAIFNASSKKIKAYVIQFNTTIFDVNLQEFSFLNQLFNKALFGVAFNLKNNTSYTKLLKQIENSQGLEKYFSLIKLLRVMHEDQYSKLLCSTSYNKEYTKNEERRILKVCDYIHSNYRKKIKVDELAKLASMNTSAFCRFFKKVLGKTVVEYINELRVNHVCKQMLQSTTTPIYQLAYETGFSNLSHFNKTFKRITNKTPKTYRQFFTP